METLFIVSIILVETLLFLIMEWHARGVFVAIAYPRKYGHGKSFMRAQKHYKKNWSFIERMLWVPVFKEKYEDKYVAFAYISYIHCFLCIFSICYFLVYLLHFPLLDYPERKIWGYELAVYTVCSVLRYIYSSAVGSGEI